ncbi:MAG: phospholipase D family protein [Clostridia bacterium]|nr:phospholipase D family protein [Clostridia bacterium]
MKNKMDENNISLFDYVDTQENHSGKLDVVELDYVTTKAVTWQELFRGYNKIRAITYSSNINFIYKLLEMFDEAEIIFGNEMVMSGSIQEIMAYQNQLLLRMRENVGNSRQELLERIDNGTVSFFVAHKQMSHEKIYLLEATDGRKRVIMGSANMSYNAFGGFQRENICYIDNENAYNWYLSCFDDLKENSTNTISKKALMIADTSENIDALPISEYVYAKKAFIVETEKELLSEVQFILDVHNLAKELKPIIPKADKKNGKTYLMPDAITKIRRQRIEENIRDKELRSEYPHLIVDAEKMCVLLNGEKVNLEPKKEEVAADVDLFLRYMDGYSTFHGNFAEMQYRYFEFANWFFCSPFIAVMRDMASRYEQNKLPYPVFGLVYGQSKAGKTSFLETLLKMMIGQKPKLAAPDFTRSSIENLKRTVKGAPIIVDDLTQTRFNQHAIETIKNDDFGISEHIIHYPAVVISANEDVKAVAPEVIRRTVICRVEAGLTNTEVMKSNVVRSIQQKIGTAFYREYLSRMLQRLPELIDIMKDEAAISAPDILEVSSQTIVEIFKEHHVQLPQYVRHLSLDDYFSEHVTGKFAKENIRNAWKTSPKSFVIQNKTNELRYNAGQSYEADRLMKELPETLEAHKVREWIVMNLSEARDFFGIDFKKSLFKIKV